MVFIIRERMKQIVVQLIAAFFGSLGFSLLFGQRRRYLLVSSLGGLFAWGVYLIAQRLFGAPFFSNLFAAAFSVLWAEALAHLLKSPATLFLTPAILPLVPGGELYYAMSSAVRGQAEAARLHGAATLRAALAIGAGISLVLALRELHAKRS